MTDSHKKGRFFVANKGNLVQLWVCEPFPFDRNANLFLDQESLKALIEVLQEHVIPDD